MSADSRKIRIVVDPALCKASGECVKVCPERAISLIGGRAVVDHALCDLDGLCIPSCPNGAIGFEEIK